MYSIFPEKHNYSKVVQEQLAGNFTGLLQTMFVILCCLPFQLQAKCVSGTDLLYKIFKDI